MASRRSIEDVQDHLQGESAWRKRELGTLSMMMKTARPHEQEVLQRAAVTLTYAHWEGYVKAALEEVLRYIAQQGLKQCQVNESLLTRSVEGAIRSAAGSGKRRELIGVVTHLRSSLEEKCRLETTISTRSNLNAEVFEDLMQGLGVEVVNIWDSQSGVTDIDLDERLLARRNSIAHGTWVVPDQGECQVLIDSVRALMDEITVALVGYIARRNYMADTFEGDVVTTN